MALTYGCPDDILKKTLHTFKLLILAIEQVCEAY